MLDQWTRFIFLQQYFWNTPNCPPLKGQIPLDHVNSSKIMPNTMGLLKTMRKYHEQDEYHMLKPWAIFQRQVVGQTSLLDPSRWQEDPCMRRGWSMWESTNKGWDLIMKWNRIMMIPISLNMCAKVPNHQKVPQHACSSATGKLTSLGEMY